MAKQLQEAPSQQVAEQVNVERPKRARLSAEETRQRMEAFDERKEQFIASVRKGKSDATSARTSPYAGSCCRLNELDLELKP